ncbi:oxidoreductase [Vulcanibacillus modesticaldus]|uniref:Oxidoreductase n=1 Tax=Vulcanibacillus modesticaldus TaxID=337097 RepID=A0A1D2YVB8_9BACI|nr:molybdopterin-dependent oxidoreductase [Vulcanibacillus modesticaldus]OEF99674.1 oxidoreductase [Vulcanibacillus modesticaldus]
MKQWRTACPLNCYDVCGLTVTVNQNKIVKIEGDPSHPITRGKICGKGKLLKDRLNDSKRLLYPLKKVDEKFIRISWDQALDEISQRMLDVREKYGPTAILHSYDYASGGLLKGLDQRFFNFFGGMTEVIGSLCWGAGIQGQLYDFGDSLSHDVEDIKNANVILIWGRNITTTNIHLLPFILDAKKSGAKLIVIDPINTGIAKKADLHIKIQPGMDGLLALVISKIIIDNGWHDMDFINKYSIGFDELRKEIGKLDIEKISEEINVEQKLIYDLAYMYAKQKPVMTFLGLGMQRYANGGNSIRAIDALIALSGNVGISGGGVQYANLAVGRSFNWKELLRVDLRKEYRTFKRPSQADEIINAQNPPIKIVFVTRSNPITQLPNQEKTITSFEKIETKIVIDMFMTDTARLADYILPTTSVFEEEDIYYGSMFHNVIRYGPKIVEPRGEAWSDLKIWTELAERLGLNGFKKNSEEYFEIALKPLDKYGIDFKTLKENGQLRLPVPSIPWQDKKFSTPSQKFEFYSERAKKEGLPPTAVISYPKESLQVNPDLNGKYPYNLLSIHPSKSLHSQHHLLVRKEDSKPWIIISKTIATEHKINNGDLVQVFNERGFIIGYAKVEQKMNEKTIVIEEGWWRDSDASVNILTSNQLSDMGNGSILYDCAVMINTLPRK